MRGARSAAAVLTAATVATVWAAGPGTIAAQAVHEAYSSRLRGRLCCKSMLRRWSQTLIASPTLSRWLSTLRSWTCRATGRPPAGEMIWLPG
jgi:hypothetical protein